MCSKCTLCVRVLVPPVARNLMWRAVMTSSLCTLQRHPSQPTMQPEENTRFCQLPFTFMRPETRTTASRPETSVSWTTPATSVSHCNRHSNSCKPSATWSIRGQGRPCRTLPREAALPQIESVSEISLRLPDAGAAASACEPQNPSTRMGP